MESFCVGGASAPCDRAKRGCAFCVFFWDATPMPTLIRRERAWAKGR
jgi:hypothetical protein